jgi:hypothetical protein
MKNNSNNSNISWYFFNANAQQEKGITGLNNWLNNWTEFKPNKVEYGERIKYSLETFQ